MRHQRSGGKRGGGLHRHPLFVAALIVLLALLSALALQGLGFAGRLGLSGGEWFGALAAAAAVGLLALLVQRQLMLRQSQERLIEAVEALSEGFALYDADDRLVLCNRKYREIYRCTSNLLVPGARFEDVVRASAAAGRFALGPEEVETFVARRCREHRNPGLPTEQKLAGERWVQVSERRTSQGGTVGVRTDITALKRAETMMRDALAAEEQANRAKSRFLAAASHDLRQPLHAMGLFVGALAERVEGLEAGEILGNLRTTLGALDEMLNALLDISKLDAGVTKPALAEVALGPLLRRLHAEFGPEACAKGLDFRIVECSASVRSDPALLESLLRNLLSNALRYTVRGKVLLGCRRRGNAVALEVRDTGIGIPPAQIEEIFEEFRRLEPVGTNGVGTNGAGVNAARGAGLGLAIVQRTARLLEHPLTVRSMPEKGSLFGVALPLLRARVPAAPEVGARPAMPASQPLGGRRVLVIDDDGAVLTSMRGLLSSWGCEVRTASSLAQALSSLDGAPPPELVIADYRLQAETGVEAIAEMRRVLGRPLPAVVVTGDSALVRRAGRLDGLPILLKPVPPARLRALLNFALAGAPASRVA